MYEAKENNTPQSTSQKLNLNNGAPLTNVT